MATFRVGLNPLPWVLTHNGLDLTETVLRSAFAEIAMTSFRAIHADPPASLDASSYRRLLAEYGLRPAPGYFGADFSVRDPVEIAEAAKRHASLQADLGNTEVFIADSATPERQRHPAVGAGFDASRLQRTIDAVGAAAQAITDEGVRPALHPHVGTSIEVEHEVRAVLDAIPDSLLGFGPDTGHLAWAGVDPAALMADYASRVAAVHLKDVHLDQVVAARADRANYDQATRTCFSVWTEPGRGDIDLMAALSALPTDFSGWCIVEVDVPEAETNLESTRISAEWVRNNLGESAF